MRAHVARDYDGDAARVWTEAAAPTTSARASARCPASATMKVKAARRRAAPALRRRPTAEALVPTHPTLGDVDSPEALAEYQAGKRAQKAAKRAERAAAGG